MENEILSQIITTLVPVLLTLLTTWFGVLGNKIKRVYEEKINTQVKKQVVDSTVDYVQQVYKNLEGEQKLQKAIEQASLILAEKGINISEVELKMLIEAAVYGLKKGYYEEENRIKTMEADTVALSSEVYDVDKLQEMNSEKEAE